MGRLELAHKSLDLRPGKHAPEIPAVCWNWGARGRALARLGARSWARAGGRVLVAARCWARAAGGRALLGARAVWARARASAAAKLLIFNSKTLILSLFI